ncbi:unnamed protein product [Closterium sp. NIES-54]
MCSSDTSEVPPPRYSFPHARAPSSPSRQSKLPPPRSPSLAPIPGQPVHQAPRSYHNHYSPPPLKTPPPPFPPHPTRPVPRTTTPFHAIPSTPLVSHTLQPREEGERMEELAGALEAVHLRVESDEHEEGNGLEMRQGSLNVVSELEEEVQMADHDITVVYQRREAGTKKRYDQGGEAREEEANQREEQKRMRLEDEGREVERKREEEERTMEEERRVERGKEEARQREGKERLEEQKWVERENEKRQREEKVRKREEDRQVEREKEENRQREEKERYQVN